MQTTKAPAGYVLEAREGRALWHLGALIVFKAVGAETGDRFWAIEGLADRQMVVPLHTHSREEEFWYVLEGEIAFTIGNETRVAGPGSFVYIPRDVPHTFRMASQTARWFGVGVPAGLYQWFFETGEPAQALTLLPSPVGPPDVDALVASLKAYGTEVVGPPPSVEH